MRELVIDCTFAAVRFIETRMNNTDLVPVQPAAPTRARRLLLPLHAGCSYPCTPAAPTPARRLLLLLHAGCSYPCTPARTTGQRYERATTSGTPTDNC
ncbi:hypothetical protein Barb6_01921 [Bacteroidales bacterium Barb6]|nr:hypothetical protein Barb6_01921 [Bacteroidales bacterium Barb6]